MISTQLLLRCLKNLEILSIFGNFHAYFRKPVASGDKNLLLRVEGVFLNILSLFLSGLVQIWLTPAPTGPKISKFRQKAICRGEYLIIAANNLVIRIERGRLPLFSFLFEVSISTERLTARLNV